MDSKIKTLAGVVIRQERQIREQQNMIEKLNTDIESLAGMVLELKRELDTRRYSRR